MQRGFVPLYLLVGALILAALGGAYYFGKLPVKPAGNDPKACTEEAKVCPDGSSAGRTGPNCEFTACPIDNPQATDETANWKTYTNTKYGFSFKYPAELTISLEQEADGDLLVDFSTDDSGFPRMSVYLYTGKDIIQQQKVDLATILSTNQLFIQGSGNYKYLPISSKDIDGESLHVFAKDWSPTLGHDLPPAGGPLAEVVALGTIGISFYKIHYPYKDPENRDASKDDEKTFTQIISTFKLN